MLKLHELPIAARPRAPVSQTFLAMLFVVVFDFSLIFINVCQFVFLLPLRFAPFSWTWNLYKSGIRLTKGMFTCVLLGICHVFAPTTFLVTFETEGKGAFDRAELDKIVVRDDSGKVLYLNLPTKFVMTANHQTYADWWYAWCFLYFITKHGVHRDMYITLQKRFRWVPIVGWGMQFFDFIFLAQSWASDRKLLASSLATLGKEAQRENKPFVFLLYPEGTLVTENTRPRSKKFADKMGIDDMHHTLLPRSTGLHYVLRSLSPRVQDLRILDLTVIYPGIPPLGYGQNYYTLRSIFCSGIPPPEIHLHLRVFNVRDLPIGDLSASNPAVIPEPVKDKQVVEVDIPDDEKRTFDLWLRDLWKAKDDAIARYFETKSLAPGQVAVEIPLKL